MWEQIEPDFDMCKNYREAFDKVRKIRLLTAELARLQKRSNTPRKRRPKK
jgi:hypothetical protein